GSGQDVNPDFERLVDCRKEVARELAVPDDSIELSMGMSQDYVQAIKQGTTSVRVGSAIFGDRVGILDVDLCGPSIPRMLNVVDERIKQGASGWIPVTVIHEAYSLSVMSIAFLLPNRDDAVVWRGPKKNSMIKQFLFSVEWGHLDYLVIDTPPGTSDEHLAIVEYLAPLGPRAVMVSTPQLVALADVEKEINFCRQVALPVLGLVENMSGYLCPHCEHCTNVFSSDGGRGLAERYQLDFLGRIPIFPKLTRLLESEDSNLLRDYALQTPEMYAKFREIVQQLNLVL
ncbi:Cytosolic Fe-S cluster assembly factor CFD1, partial [Paramicrosporidium saccamoebae]